MKRSIHFYLRRLYEHSKTFHACSRETSPAAQTQLSRGCCWRQCRGSKFKAVNARDRNFTKGKIDKRQQQIEESIQRYLNALETADRTQPAELEAKTTRLQDKITQLRQQMRVLDEVKEKLKSEPDGQISLTDPDSRSMATSGRGSGMVAYNVQVAVDAKHHMIVAHEVTNAGSDRAQLSPMAIAAREAMGTKKLRAIADN